MDETSKHWRTLSSFDAIYTNNPQNIHMDTFSWRNLFLFLVYKERGGWFRIKYQVSF